MVKFEYKREYFKSDVLHFVCDIDMCMPVRTVAQKKVFEALFKALYDCKHVVEVAQTISER